MQMFLTWSAISVGFLFFISLLYAILKKYSGVEKIAEDVKFVRKDIENRQMARRDRERIEAAIFVGKLTHLLASKTNAVLNEASGSAAGQSLYLFEVSEPSMRIMVVPDTEPSIVVQSCAFRNYMGNDHCRLCAGPDHAACITALEKGRGTMFDLLDFLRDRLGRPE